MRFAVLVAFAAVLPLPFGASFVQAQPQSGAGNPVDVGKIPESGPLVVGGGGMTAGPNSKNQAVSPMPGSREEELSERPSNTLIVNPDVVPIPGAPLPAKPATKTR